MPKKNPATGDPILDALKAERERRGWSQTELAQRIGRRTYNTPYQWESGSNEPTLSSLREWAGALGYDVTLTLREPAEQPEPARGVGWRLARDEEIQDAAHMAAMEERHQHEAEQPEGSDRWPSR